MVTGFWIDREAPGVEDEIVQIRGVNGTQYAEGDAIMVSNATSNYGLAVQIPAVASPAQYIFLAMVSDKSYLRPAVFDTPTAAYEYLELIEVNKTSIVMNTQFAAATYDGTAAAANSSGANTVKMVGTGTTLNTDFLGGQIYVNELNQQATIIACSVTGGSSGTYTFTVAPAFSRQVTTGDTLRVVPWGAGYAGGVKFMASTPWQGISTALADITGGPIFIYGVDLAKRIAYVRFDSALI